MGPGEGRAKEYCGRHCCLQPGGHCVRSTRVLCTGHTNLHMRGLQG